MDKELTDGRARPITHWTTKEGERVRIKDMGDSHLFNTLAFCVERRTQARAMDLYRLSESFTPYIDALHEECLKREPAVLQADLINLLGE